MSGSVTGVVPRWEWRAFDDALGDAEDLLRVLPVERTEDSDEVYLLSSESEASVKIRGGKMDVKQLESVGEDGLEQWRPVLKADFPLAAADVATVMASLGVAAPTPARSEYTLDVLLGEVVGPTPELAAVRVHKHREHHTVSGCMAERAELRAEQGSRRTIAVESEDSARVIAALRELGLEGRRNVSVPRGLKALVGLGSLRYAVIDVGTNSVKFHLAERAADGNWMTLADRAEVTRLGEGLNESKRLGEAPMHRTVEAIVAMAQEARDAGVAAIAAVGTAGLRVAPNRDELIDAVREQAAVEVEVISGEDEARLACLATTSALGAGAGSLAVFDTGGGSSQFTFGAGERVEERFSVNVGAARFTEHFGLDAPVSDEALAEARAAIAGDLWRLDGRGTPDMLVGMGGAVTNLAAVKHALERYDAEVVHGTVLDRAEIDRQIELYRTRSADDRRGIVGLQPKRAEVILAGACIVSAVLERLGCESFTVSDRGLRHGLLTERFGR